MKKWLCTIMAALLLLSMTACGGPSTTPESTGDTQSSAVIPENTTKQESTENNNSVSNTQETLVKFRLPAVSAYCMAPKSCGRKVNEKVAVAQSNKNYIASVYCGDADSFNGQLEEMLTACAGEYTSGMNKYLYPSIKKENLKAETTEKVTISGFEAVKFTGEITNGLSGVYKIYGYSTVIDERPVMFIGFLVSEEQGDADLQAMQALVDQMAGSIAK